VKLRLSAILGAVAVLVGLLVLVWEDLATAISLEWALVLLVAIIAGVQTLRFVQERRSTPLRATETRDPEQRYAAPTPGDDADETLGTASGWSARRRRSRGQLRERVGQAAMAAVVNATGCRQEEAARRIESGEWTDDPVAAAFLSEQVSLTARERLRLVLGSPGSQFLTQVDRAVKAVERLTEEP